MARTPQKFSHTTAEDPPGASNGRLVALVLQSAKPARRAASGGFVLLADEAFSLP
jgi:hypothetical protein